MKTIELYENTETIVLKSLLKEFETFYRNIESIIHVTKSKNEDYEEYQKISKDYEIDIHLIRMELNKRLWNENN